MCFIGTPKGGSGLKGQGDPGLGGIEGGRLSGWIAFAVAARAAGPITQGIDPAGPSVGC